MIKWDSDDAAENIIRTVLNAGQQPARWHSAENNSPDRISIDYRGQTMYMTFGDYLLEDEAGFYPVDKDDYNEVQN